MCLKYLSLVAIKLCAASGILEKRRYLVAALLLYLLRNVCLLHFEDQRELFKVLLTPIIYIALASCVLQHIINVRKKMRIE